MAWALSVFVFLEVADQPEGGPAAGQDAQVPLGQDLVDDHPAGVRSDVDDRDRGRDRARSHEQRFGEARGGVKRPRDQGPSEANGLAALHSSLAGRPGSTQARAAARGSGPIDPKAVSAPRSRREVVRNRCQSFRLPRRCAFLAVRSSALAKVMSCLAAVPRIPRGCHTARRISNPCERTWATARGMNE